MILAPFFEPFFQSKAIADEITRRQTVAEQMKWTLYFTKWGCLICGTKDAPHDTLGMCARCHRRTYARLQGLLKCAEAEQRESQGIPAVVDLTETAQAALRSVGKSRPRFLPEGEIEE